MNAFCVILPWIAARPAVRMRAVSVPPGVDSVPPVTSALSPRVTTPPPLAAIVPALSSTVPWIDSPPGPAPDSVPWFVVVASSTSLFVPVPAIVALFTRSSPVDPSGA